MTPEEELSAHFEALQLRFDRTLNFLAWIIQQEEQPGDLTREVYWPADVEVSGEPLLSWLATKDRTVWELARHQIADCLQGDFQISEDAAELAVRLLQMPGPPPLKKSGASIARNSLILAVFDQVFDWNPWRLADQNSLGGKPRYLSEIGPREQLERLRPELPSETAISEALADALTIHDLLKSLPDTAPSADAVRSVWRNREKIKGLTDECCFMIGALFK